MLDLNKCKELDGWMNKRGGVLDLKECKELDGWMNKRWGGVLDLKNVQNWMVG